MKHSVIGLLAAAIVGLGARDAQAATLFVDMVPGGIVDGSRLQAPGDNFNISILIGAVVDLAGFQFEVEYDDSIISASSIVSGAIFGPDTFLIHSTIGPGLITFAETTLALTGVNVLGPVVLGNIHFNVLAEGTSLLDLRNSLLSDALAGPIGIESETDGQLIARTSVQGVPEPASVLLVSLGVASLVARTRARARAPSQAPVE